QRKAARMKCIRQWWAAKAAAALTPNNSAARPKTTPRHATTKVGSRSAVGKPAGNRNRQSTAAAVAVQKPPYP
ncbi:unnamed protein product, partial [Ceratitis capitata]